MRDWAPANPLPFLRGSGWGAKGAAMPRHTHILNAASNLLGIALVIIAGLKVTRMNGQSFADEIAWAAAVCLSLSCILSYIAIRAEPEGSRAEAWADRIFLLGLVTLFGSVLALATAAI
jgi:hypothetical protein